MAEGSKDFLPVTVEGCDQELTTASEALSSMSPRSRRLTLTRIDKLLDRRLLLVEQASDAAGAVEVPAFAD